MAKTLKTDLNFRVIWEYVNTPDSGQDDAPATKDNNTFQVLDGMTNGTGGEDLSNILWHDIRTLSASSNEEFDLHGGLTDAFGHTLNFTVVKCLVIHNRNVSSAPAVLEIGGATNAFSSWLGSATDTIKISSESMFTLWNPTTAGYAVTAGTGDILKVTNTSADDDVTYQIAVIGTV